MDDISEEVLLAQWLQHPTGVMEVEGSIPPWIYEIFSEVSSPIAKQPSFTVSFT